MIFLLWLLFVTPLSANKQDESYHVAHKLYKAGQYEQALENYESLQFQGPTTYYNSGNAYYQLQQYGKALAAWAKAEVHAGPRLLKKIRANKDKAYKKLAKESSEGWYAWAVTVQSYFSVFLLQIIFLLCWFVWWFAHVLHKKYSKKYHWIFLLISVWCATLLMLTYWVKEGCYAVVTVHEAPLFIGPNKDFDTKGSVKEGDFLGVIQKEDAWYQVKTQNEKGWVQADTVEKIH